MTSSPTLKLSDGHLIPQIGLGVYKVENTLAAQLVESALHDGYRHVDTAVMYANEVGVGEGVRASGVPRDDVFVTSKIWDDDHGFEPTLRAVDASLAALGFDYVDLMLIHWPNPRKNLYVETWRALQSARDDGRIRSIGVSNFHPHHIQRLIDETGEAPVLNQVELHPRLPQRDVQAWDDRHNIVTESWAPLARGGLIDDPTLASLAAKHGRTPAQVIIRWHLQRGLVVIPKSNSPERIRSNFDVFGFDLDADDLEAIAALENGERTGMNPDDHG